MEPQLCLNCQSPIAPKEGKRAKKYCNDNCRAAHWSKAHPRKGQEGWKKKYEELKKAYEELMAQVNSQSLQRISQGVRDLPTGSFGRAAEKTKGRSDMEGLASLDGLSGNNLRTDGGIEGAVFYELKPPKTPPQERVAPFAQPPVSKEKPAAGNKKVEKGYRTFTLEIGRADKKDKLTALSEEIGSSTKLHDNDKYKLGNAIDKRLSELK